MCYKSRAVKGAAKQEVVPVQREQAEVSTQGTTPAKDEGTKSIAGEDASRYCPVCSQRLESRRCKLICPVCGYYMSCADYY
jgi:Zn finger protein HypA/HybF involved in hydrogenase expression